MPNFIIVYHGGNEPETKRLVPRKWQSAAPSSISVAPSKSRRC